MASVVCHNGSRVPGCSATLRELPAAEPLTQTGLGVSRWVSAVAREGFSVTAAPGALLTVPAASSLPGHSTAQGLRGYREQLLCSSTEPGVGAAWGMLAVRAGHCTCPSSHRPCGSCCHTALSPGHTSIQKVNVGMYLLSLSMWGHCFHSLCYLFPCTRPEIHALFLKSSLLNSSLVLYSSKLTPMLRTRPTFYFSNNSWTFPMAWHETKDLFLYQGRGNYSFPVLPNTIL